MISFIKRTSAKNIWMAQKVTFKFGLKMRLGTRELKRITADLWDYFWFNIKRYLVFVGISIVNTAFSLV